MQKVTPHRSEAVRGLSSNGRKLFKYVEFDDDEALLAEIKKHPLGLVIIWLIGGFVMLAITIGTALLAAGAQNSAPLSTTSDGISTQTALLLVGLLVGLLAFIFTGITSWLYTSDVVFVTSEKIAQVSYIGLFNRRVTQLNIGKVEDVTVTQNGIIPHLFDFGTILVETAGETTNPSFKYTPKPNAHAQTILQAHEEYVQKYGN